MINLLNIDYSLVIMIAEIIKFAFYCSGLWLCLKWIDKN